MSSSSHCSLGGENEGRAGGSCLSPVSMENWDTEELLGSALASENHGTCGWGDRGGAVCLWTAHLSTCTLVAVGGRWWWISSVVRMKGREVSPRRNLSVFLESSEVWGFYCAFTIRYRVGKWLVRCGLQCRTVQALKTVNRRTAK